MLSEASIIELHDSLEFICEKYFKKGLAYSIVEMSLLDCNLTENKCVLENRKKTFT